MAQLMESLSLTATEARSLVTRINRQSADVRELLLKLHDGEGWKALGYESWKDCVEKEFIFGRAHAYRLLEAAQIENRLRLVSPIGDAPLPEAHLRELANVPEEKQATVYESARKTSPGGVITAEHIRDTAAHLGALPNRWGPRAAESNWQDYLPALGRLTAPQIEGVLRKCLPSIPARVLFKAVDEVRHMTPDEQTAFNNVSWKHSLAIKS